MTPEVLALLDQAAERYKLATELVRAVAWVESRGNQAVVSSAGAIGIMQLMPATAIGLKVDPHDPAQNVDGGARFLARLIERFGIRAGLAAYNWGPGNVTKATDNNRSWPGQVRTYVDRVLTRAQHYANELGTAESTWVLLRSDGDRQPIPAGPPETEGPGTAEIPFDRGGESPESPDSQSWGPFSPTQQAEHARRYRVLRSLFHQIKGLLS